MGNPGRPSQFDELFNIVLFNDSIHWVETQYIYAFVSLLSDFLPISIVKYLADGTFSGYAPTGSQTFDQSIIKLIFDVPNIIELHNNNDSNQR